MGSHVEPQTVFEGDPLYMLKDDWFLGRQRIR